MLHCAFTHYSLFHVFKIDEQTNRIIKQEVKESERRS